MGKVTGLVLKNKKGIKPPKNPEQKSEEKDPAKEQAAEKSEQ